MSYAEHGEIIGRSLHIWCLPGRGNWAAHRLVHVPPPRDDSGHQRGNRANFGPGLHMGCRATAGTPD